MSLRDCHLITPAGRTILPRRRGGLARGRSFTCHLITSPPRLDSHQELGRSTAVAQNAVRCTVASLLHRSMQATPLPAIRPQGWGLFLSRAEHYT